MPRLVEMNAIRCKNCGDIIISLTIHETVTCQCGDVAVDGGKDYRKTSVKVGAKGYLSGFALIGPWPHVEPTSMRDYHRQPLDPAKRKAQDALRALGAARSASPRKGVKKGMAARKRKGVKR